MNPEKLKKLETQVRIGGKGTPRRKKKIVRSRPITDKKLQSSLTKLFVYTIPGINEVNIMKNDGSVIHFNNPKAEASLSKNTFAITGHGENKSISELLPGILAHLGPQDLEQLKKLVSEFVKTNSVAATAAPSTAAASAAAVASLAAAASTADYDDVPDLVENFEEIAISGENNSSGNPGPSSSSKVSSSTGNPSTTTEESQDSNKIEEIPLPVA